MGQPFLLGAAITLEEVEEAAAGTQETTTSLAPVLLITGGGGEVLRRLPGTTEGLATTRAIITTRGDVSGTPSVPGLSSVAICTGDTSAPRLSTGDKSIMEQNVCTLYNKEMLF